MPPKVIREKGIANRSAVLAPLNAIVSGGKETDLRKDSLDLRWTLVANVCFE